MASSIARHGKRDTNIWPGFVDALASLLMVIVFLLMIFVVAQFFLKEQLSGRDEQLEHIQGRMSELADLLAMERLANADMRSNATRMSGELQASVTLNEGLGEQVRTLGSALAEKSAAVEKQAVELATLTNGIAALKALKEKLETDIAKADAELAATAAALAKMKGALSLSEARRGQSEQALAQRGADLQQTRAELAKALAALAKSDAALAQTREKLEQTGGTLTKTTKDLTRQRELSEQARAQLALLNQQTAALRQQLAAISAQLDAAESKNRDQKATISALGQRLNVALASKVQELSRYRSEFFGRLRDLLGKTRGVRIVGDRFVFQSEVLFSSGSADIGADGGGQLAALASTLRDVAARIPGDIDWVLRVDGHTDRVPIKTERYPSNWELSAARAISVVKSLVAEGLPPNRLVAAGFGEFQPIDARTDEIGNLRNRRIEFKLTQR